MKRGAVGAMLLAIAALVLGPAPLAHAHTELILSLPDDGAEVATVPDEVLLTFSEDVLPDTVVVSVEDSTGMVVRVLELEVDGADVMVTWPPGMSGDEYTVNYRVVSADGHPVEGSVYFRVANAGASSATPQTTAPSASATSDAVHTEDGESSGSLALVVAIVVGLGVGLGVAGVLLVVQRRRSDTGTTPPADPGDER